MRRGSPTSCPSLASPGRAALELLVGFVGALAVLLVFALAIRSCVGVEGLREHTDAIERLDATRGGARPTTDGGH